MQTKLNLMKSSAFIIAAEAAILLCSQDFYLTAFVELIVMFVVYVLIAMLTYCFTT